MGKHTQPDPVDEFIKQYEQQHKNINTYNEQSYNNFNKNTVQRKSHERTHNNSEGDHSDRITKMVLVTGLTTETETTLMIMTSAHNMKD